MKRSKFAAVLVMSAMLFGVVQPVSAGWFDNEHSQPSSVPNDDGAWLGTVCAICGGVIGFFCFGGPLGAAAGAAIAGAAGLEYGNASDAERKKIDERNEAIQDGLEAGENLGLWKLK